MFTRDHAKTAVCDATWTERHKQCAIFMYDEAPYTGKISLCVFFIWASVSLFRLPTKDICHMVLQISRMYTEVICLGNHSIIH